MNRWLLRTAVGLTVLLIALCVATGLVGSPPDSSGGGCPSRVERLRGLAEVWGMAHFFHPALDDLQMQTAWRAAAMLAIPDVEAAETAEDYAHALGTLVSFLGDCMTQIVWKDELSKLWGPSINISYIDGKTIVSSAGDTRAEGIVGHEVLEVNGQRVDSFLEDHLPITGGETDMLKREWIYGRLLSGPPGETITLLLADADGGTTVQTMSIPTEAEFLAPPVSISSEMTEDAMLWVKIPSLLPLLELDEDAYAGTDLQSYQTSLASIHRAEGVVLDFRTGGHAFAMDSAATILLPELLAQFAPIVGFRAIGARLREHRGYEPLSGQFAAGAYVSGWRTENGPFVTSGWRRDMPLVLLVDAGSYPFAMPYLAPLQEAGMAVVMGEEFGSAPFEHTYLHELPGGLTFGMRLSIADSDAFGLGMLLVESSPESGEDAVLEAALAALRAWDDRDEAIRYPAPQLGTPLTDPQLTAAATGTRAARLLGLFELWNAVQYFYAYPEMIDGDWGELLERYIPRIELAETPGEYAKAIQELLVHLRDGHAFVLGRPWKTTPVPQFEIEEIEGTAVATTAIPVRADTGTIDYLPPGQVILEINGEAVETVLDDLLLTSPGAREEHCRYRAHALLLSEIRAETIELLLQDARGEEGIAQLCRQCNAPLELREREAWWVENNIAYLDICSLGVTEYREIEERVRASDGLIIDLRRYPRAGMFSAIPELVFSEPTVYLQASIPIRSTPDPSVREVETSWPKLPVTTVERFEGPIVVLTSVAATSAAETMCMFLQDAAGATLVGGITSGTNGNVAEVRLPLGVSALFSGMEVRHADGRPFQGIGIIPDVEVHPTIQGIREGRDEILEKGLEVLRELIAQRKGSD